MKDSANILDQLIEALTSLPGVGIRSAQRMSYFLLQENHLQDAKNIADSLQQAIEKIRPCTICQNLTQIQPCNICTSAKRNEKLLCIVESPINLLNIEKTGQYFGKYFVLMGLISPLDGVGTKELGLDRLADLIAQRQIEEIILGISASVEGQATSFYIKKIAQKYNIKITQLAQGVPVGSELDYIDQQTLALAINERHEFN